MKKILLTSVVVFLASYAFSQNISGGIKAGLNLADQKFSIDGITVGHKFKPGFHGGLFLTVMFSDQFGIQPEVLYSMQGSKLDLEFFGYDYKTSFNYLAIPILVRYNFTDRFSVHAGPQIGFLMSAEVEESDGTQVTTTDVKDDYKGTEFSGAIGGEVEIIAGLGAGARYVFGLTKINKDGDGDNGTAKNSVIQIYVKYRLFGGSNK